MDGRIAAEATAWADPEKINSVFADLRRHDPVSLVDVPGYEPFWLVTRHADVQAVERDAAGFTNHPRTVLQTAELDARLNRSGKLRTLVHMDGTEHRTHRGVTADWFRPRSLRAVQDEVAAQATRALDDLVALGGECDFAAEIALGFPLRVILSIMGLPAKDYGLMLRLTQELFGAQDPDLRREENAGNSYGQVFGDLFRYYAALTRDRRAEPTTDLSSVIANADISEVERLSYYVLIATAGHDTTSYSIAGGLLALLQHPDQLELLRRRPELIDGAVEEILRWTTPARHFMRTAQRDRELGGARIRAGESLMLSYVAANRDETVFPNPDRFDVTRTPNRQVAFGLGVHTCLGANLARMEMRLLFAELLRRLPHLELAGEPAWSQSLIVGGVKRLPIRYELERA
ncbi:cytochrome P450 [Pseudonocardia sp. Cha107L01]|jgi:cytochrome P450|uniref:cytochrome P450 n=1 Tax=Pseudonocardia sp. Cha107L01 TaxID=3457576 RepID=UPI00403EDD24